jgi:hypothetical protein
MFKTCTVRVALAEPEEMTGRDLIQRSLLLRDRTDWVVLSGVILLLSGSEVEAMLEVGVLGSKRIAQELEGLCSGGDMQKKLKFESE